MLPKIGAIIELKDGRWVRVAEQNPNGYDPNKPQEFIGVGSGGIKLTLTVSDIHTRYFR